MFEQLLEIIQQQGKESIVDNPSVPNEQNEAVMQEAASSVTSGMQEMAQQGGPGAIKTLFENVQSGHTDHPAVQQLSDRFAGNITNKFGIPGNAAKALAISLIPVVLNKMMHRAKDPNDSGFNIGSILGSIMGNNQVAAQPQAGNSSSGGLMDTINSMGARFGLDKNGDGKTDLQDLMKMFGH